MAVGVYHGEAFVFTAHALGYLERRGFSSAEVEDTIRTSKWERSASGRLECRKNYPFNAIWNGKRYTTKQIRPIFVVEHDEIIVITAYTYYFNEL